MTVTTARSANPIMNRYKYKVSYQGGATSTGAVKAYSRRYAETIVRENHIGIDVVGIVVWQAGKCE